MFSFKPNVMIFFNLRCVCCHRPLQVAHHGLCSRCYKPFSDLTYCGRCGERTLENRPYCGKCLTTPPKWSHMVIASRYEPPLSTLIHRFKFQQQFWLDRTLARTLLLAIHQARRTHQLELPQLILPVPLHHFRQWRRGYNQAALIAQYLAQKLRIAYRDDVIARVKHTHTQRGLSAHARQRNLHQAFAVRKPIVANSVALVDDVITTGATLNAISQLLHQQGITAIQVWGICRA